MKSGRHQLRAENKSSAAEPCIRVIKQPGIFKGLCKTQMIIFKRNSILLRRLFSLLPNEKIIWRLIRPSFLCPVHTENEIKTKQTETKIWQILQDTKWPTETISLLLFAQLAGISGSLFPCQGTEAPLETQGHARGSKTWASSASERGKNPRLVRLEVYHHHAAVPAVGLHRRMAAWQCQRRRPGLITAPPALHHRILHPDRSPLHLSHPCPSGASSQHWHIWKSLDSDRGLPLKVRLWLSNGALWPSPTGLGHADTHCDTRSVGAWESGAYNHRSKLNPRGRLTTLPVPPLLALTNQFLCFSLSLY